MIKRNRLSALLVWGFLFLAGQGQTFAYGDSHIGIGYLPQEATFSGDRTVLEEMR